MPDKTVYIQPEVIARRHGIVVLRTYKNNDADESSSFHFTTQAVIDVTGENDAPSFDLRDLPWWSDFVPSDRSWPTDEQTKGLVRHALLRGWVLTWQIQTLAGLDNRPR
jgi:hypothetical protein